VIHPSESIASAKLDVGGRGLLGRCVAMMAFVVFQSMVVAQDLFPYALVLLVVCASAREKMMGRVIVV